MERMKGERVSHVRDNGLSDDGARTLLEGLLDAVGDGATEDDDVEKRVGAETVGSVDGHASGLASSHETRDHAVGVVA